MTFRCLLLIFAAALALRGFIVGVLTLIYGPDGLLIDDSTQYLEAAARAEPQHSAMPLYLMFLSWHRWLFGLSPIWPVLSQIVVDSATCVIVGLLAATLDKRLFVPAALFAAVNPVQLVIATLILTDSLFVFFCATALLGCVRWLRAPHWRWAALTGLALGLGLLTRAMLAPWVLFLPVFMLLATIFTRGINRAVLGHVGAFMLLLPIAMQAPVVIANHANFGGWGLTTQGGVHALKWVVPLVMEARDGTSQAEGARLMSERFAAIVDPAAHATPFDHSRAMSRAALDVLLELGPVPIAKAWIYGATINLLSPAVILTKPVRDLPRTGFYATPGDGKLDKMITFLFRNDNTAYGWVLLIAALGTLACRAVQLRGAWRWLRAGIAGNRLMLASGLLCVCWIGFILAINGPIAAAKYRAPLEPAFAVLFAIGWSRRSGVGNGFTPPPGRL